MLITFFFQALCGSNLKWVAGSDYKIPVDSFKAGYSEVNREPIFIGRAIRHNNIIPGKVQLSHRVCYFTEEGRTKSVNKFEVLTEPGENVHCANKYVMLAEMRTDVRSEDEDEDEDDEDDNDN